MKYLHVFNGLMLTLILGVLTLSYLPRNNPFSVNVGVEKVKEVNTAEETEVFIYPSNHRVLSVAGHLELQGQKVLTTLKYLKMVEHDLLKDFNTARFFQNIASFSGNSNIVKPIDALTLELYNEWHISFSSEDALLRNKFPRNPYLAINNEMLAFPECKDDKAQVPTLVWAKATRKNEKWEQSPTVLEDPINNRWLIRFDDISALDERSLNRRLVVMVGCEKSAT